LRRFSAPGTDWTASSAPPSLREFRQGELSVACLPVFSQSFLPLLLQPFLARYPEVSLQIVPQESPCWRSGSPPSVTISA
jgi:DNA-binding transcriptional LysR family regulator